MTAARVSCVAVGLLLAGPGQAQPLPPTRYVDPFIGTDGSGHAFPGASVPFGMVAPSPDNADRGADYSSGYQYRAPRILGFSNTHISGAGIPELGDVLLQPAAGTRWSGATTDFSSRYDKATEWARPGYYAVTLADHGVRVELSATQRVALHRYTFNRTGRVQVLVDLQHGLQSGDAPRVTRAEASVDAVQGELTGTVHARNRVERQASFVLRFDQPIVQHETLPARPGELAPRYLLGFDLKGGQVLHARVALSTVDVDGAKRNLAEVATLRFDRARWEADRTWDELLGRIGIGASEGHRRLFYSALYRALLHPSDIADADGRVRGPTGEVIQARGGSYYSTLSLWHTFRAVHPLLTLVAPERVDGFVQTLVDHHQAMRTLPLGTAWGRETWNMIGNPALPVIADAVLKGFQGFDPQVALQAMVDTSTEPRLKAPSWAQFDWALLDRYGWLPFDKVDGESVSKTLEAGIGDDATARVAQALGRTDLARAFGERAKSYRHLFDPETRLMRGRDSQGRWRTPFDPQAVSSTLRNPGDYTEANAWQSTLTPALQDPLGMAELLGGRTALGDWLDRFFELEGPRGDPLPGQEGRLGQYAHGNEPGHHASWLYAWTDRPWQGTLRRRQITRSFYSTRPDGLPGNDDSGQLSAWLVFATMGLYPVVPSSARWALGAPLVRLIRIERPGRPALEIHAPNLVEETPHAAMISIDGKRLAQPEIDHATLLKAGVIEFGMTAPPVANR